MSARNDDPTPPRDSHRRDRPGSRQRVRGGRKERVLHTRISEQLSDDIRRLAEDLRVPTSNLVRNVLEEVFAVVESVSDDVGDLFEDVFQEAESARDRILRRRRRRRARPGASGKAETSWEDVAEAEFQRDEAREASEPSKAGTPRAPARPPVFPEIIGWQPLVLGSERTGQRRPRILERRAWRLR